MFNVMVTCPPMRGMIDVFLPKFESLGLNAILPPMVQVMSEEELIAIIPEMDAWIIGDDPATARVFEAGVRGKLKAFVKWGVGIDNVDFEATKRLGLPGRHTPGVFGAEVAEVAMNYVSGLARQTFLIDRGIRAGNWPKPSGISLAGRNVGLVGFGDIGKNTAKRLLASDVNLTVYDPFFVALDGTDIVNRPWPEGVEELDFIVFTAPLNASTHHMFNFEVLSKVKVGVRIVNVGRGPLVQEAALLEGLSSGRIHSAALDVYEVEPLAVDNPLRQFEQCIFGSHNGSNSADAVKRVSFMAIDYIAEFLQAVNK